MTDTHIHVSSAHIQLSDMGGLELGLTDADGFIHWEPIRFVSLDRESYAALEYDVEQYAYYVDQRTIDHKLPGE